MIGCRALVSTSSSSVLCQARRSLANQFDPLGQKLAQKKRETESGTQYATTQDHKKTVQDSRFQGAADADSGQTPTKWQRRFLVITRLYKSQADIPTYVHNGTMNRMHDRMRVVFIVVATSVFFTIFFISERLNFARIDRDRKAGVVVTKM